MILTVLGKYGPYPAAGGGTSSYLLKGGNTFLALDFGSGALGRMRSFTELEKLDALILSHLHNDHVSDVLPLVYALAAKGKSLDVYMPQTVCPVKDLIDAVPMFNVKPITDGTEVKIKDLTVKFTRLVHPVESYASTVSDGKSGFFYSGDTSFTDRLFKAAKGCGTLLLDASLPAEAAEGVPHLSVFQAALIARKTRARILLTHVNPEFSPYAEAKTVGLEVVEEMSSYEV